MSEPIKLEETRHVCNLPEWFNPKTSKVGFLYQRYVREVIIIVTDINKPAHQYNRESDKWEVLNA